MNHLTYKGYTAEVEYDADGGILYGRVLDLRDVITFQSESTMELVQEFHTSVNEYLAFCKEQGIDPAKPYSGRLPFRTTSVNHRKIAMAAATSGKSINAWMEQTLAAAADAMIALRVLKTAPHQEEFTTDTHADWLVDITVGPPRE